MTSAILCTHSTHAHARSGREGGYPAVFAALSQCLGGGSDPRRTDATQGTLVALLRGACDSMGSDK